MTKKETIKSIWAEQVSKPLNDLDLPRMLGLQNVLLKVAGEDILGRQLQDAGILTKKRAPKFKKSDK
jgi:hypothetical protein